MMAVIQEVIKVGTKTIDHLLTLLSLTVETLFHQKNYRKLVWRCCDELVMNQFEVKEKLNNFFIDNFIAQRNNFKIKIKLTVKKKFLQSSRLYFLWNKWYFARFLLSITIKNFILNSFINGSFKVNAFARIYFILKYFSNIYFSHFFMIYRLNVDLFLFYIFRKTCGIN